MFERSAKVLANLEHPAGLTQLRLLGLRCVALQEGGERRGPDG